MSKSPGRSTRKGISLIELFQMFPDDESAERWFEECRWGKARVPDECPMCGENDKIHQVKTRKPLPYRCGSCRRYFSVKTSSVMHRSKIPYQKWAIAVYLWSTSLKGVSSMKLHRDLNIRQATAWFMAHRLREAWDTKGDIFFGPMEVDETFIGGKEGNKHAKKKLRAGRGGVGKASVVGAKDRTTKRIVAKVVPDTKGSTLKGFCPGSAQSRRTGLFGSILVVSRVAGPLLGQPQRWGVCPRSGPYERDGVVLVAIETGIPRGRFTISARSTCKDTSTSLRKGTTSGRRTPST